MKATVRCSHCGFTTLRAYVVRYPVVRVPHDGYSKSYRVFYCLACTVSIGYPVQPVIGAGGQAQRVIPEDIRNTRGIYELIERMYKRSEREVRRDAGPACAAARRSMENPLFKAFYRRVRKHLNG